MTGIIIDQYTATFIKKETPTGWLTQLFGGPAERTDYTLRVNSPNLAFGEIRGPHPGLDRIFAGKAAGERHSVPCNPVLRANGKPTGAVRVHGLGDFPVHTPGVFA